MISLGQEEFPVHQRASGIGGGCGDRIPSVFGSLGAGHSKKW